jgi:hypothetical protein
MCWISRDRGDLPLRGLRLDCALVRRGSALDAASRDAASSHDPKDRRASMTAEAALIQPSPKVTNA